MNLCILLVVKFGRSAAFFISPHICMEVFFFLHEFENLVIPLLFFFKPDLLLLDFIQHLRRVDSYLILG